MVCVKMICQLTVLNYFLLQRRRWDCVNVWGTTEFVGRKTAFFMSITIDWIWCEGEHFPETKIDPEKLSFYSIYNLLIISFVLHYRASVFRVRKVVKSFQWLYKVQFESMSVVTGYGVHICFLPGLSYSASRVIELYTTCSK